LVELAMNAVLAFVQILDVQLDDVGDCVIEHEKAAGLFHGGACRLADVDEIENRG
jgi:hypothetical protein